jgi:hypothetical protein
MDGLGAQFEERKVASVATGISFKRGKWLRWLGQIEKGRFFCSGPTYCSFLDSNQKYLSNRYAFHVKKENGKNCVLVSTIKF